MQIEGSNNAPSMIIMQSLLWRCEKMEEKEGEGFGLGLEAVYVFVELGLPDGCSPGTLTRTQYGMFSVIVPPDTTMSPR